MSAKFLFDYIKQRKAFAAIFAAIFIIFFFSFLLYRLPVEAVIYPSALSLLLVFAAASRDCKKTFENHIALVKTVDMSAGMIGELPQSDDIEKKDYQHIIQKMQAEILEWRNRKDEQYAGMMDYYTMWVHQIKTPIASMRLTLQNDDSALSRQLLTDLHRIERYADMVLTFLRLDCDTVDYVFAPHSIDDIIRSAVRKFSTEFILRKIQLLYTPCDKTIVTDEKWLSFVIEQLLSNALKYTPRGKIEIYMQHDELFIKDSGIGIASQDIPRIFEKGYTGYNGRTDKKASGIGLYLCKRICDNMGIKIQVVSRPDEGTVFSLDLKQYDFKAE